MKKIYLDTTIPSYLVARPSKNIKLNEKKAYNTPVLCTPDEVLERYNQKLWMR